MAWQRGKPCSGLLHCLAAHPRQSPAKSAGTVEAEHIVRRRLISVLGSKRHDPSYACLQLTACSNLKSP